MRGSVLAIATVLLAACGSRDGGAAGTGGFSGHGGSGGSPEVACKDDLDGDGVRGVLCGGLDCDDRDPAVHPGAPERCGDGADQDCDGAADGGCACTPGDRRGCWSGGEATRGVGACRDGWQACGSGGAWGPCVDERSPRTEAGCDGVDDDCDGKDGASCGACPAGAVEICGNGLDDDCDGLIDDAAVCRFSCRGRDPALDPGALCCLAPEQKRYSFGCAEMPGLLPACALPGRRCIDLDGDPATRCTKACTGDGCVCGEPGAGALPTPALHCGFETPCMYLDCDDRSEQACYSGPPATAGVGICHGGHATCGADAAGVRAWGACEGEVLPAVEVCGNDLDDDCDGLIDEADGASGKACAPRRVCLATELCGDGLDDDCDGFADDGCEADAEAQVCSTAPPGVAGVGLCLAGTQEPESGYWGACRGEVLPAPETCGDGRDSDCDGLGGPGQPEDEGCCTPAGHEVCDGIDDDCDGLVDEGVVSRCGRCDDTPCEEEDWSRDLADCSVEGRACEQIRPAAGGGITLDPSDGLQPSSEILLPFVGDLLQMDADDARVIRSIFRSIPPRFGAALALDGSVWTVEDDRVSHRDPQGRVVCTRDLILPKAIGLDATGDLWVLQGAGTVTRIDGVAVSATQPDGTPWPDFKVRCAIEDLTPDDPKSFGIWLGDFYEDLVVGGEGLLWIVEPGRVIRIDMATLDRETIPTSSRSTTGVADVEGNLWLGGEPVVRISAQGPYEPIDGVRAYETRYTGLELENPLIASDGALWGASGWELVRFDPVTGFTDSWPAPTADPIRSLILDEHDRVFVPAEVTDPQRGAYWRFDGRAWSLFYRDPFYVPAPFFSPAGLSRAMLRRISGTRGTWSQIVDGLVTRARFQKLTWAAKVPSGSTAKVTVHLARRRGELATSNVACGPEDDGEIDVEACVGGEFHRFARVDVAMTALPGAEPPVVSDVRLFWTRP